MLSTLDNVIMRSDLISAVLIRKKEKSLNLTNYEIQAE